MPKFNWVLSSLLVTAMMFSGLPTGSTQTTRVQTNPSSSPLDKENQVETGSGERGNDKKVSSNLQNSSPIPYSLLPTPRHTARSWENILSNKDEDNEPPVKPATGGGTSRGGFICAIAPRAIGTITEVWSDRPLFVWQGVVGQLEVRKPATKETLWRQAVSATSRRVIYGGEPLQPGQTYHWVIFDQANRSIAEFPFQVMESEKRDRIKTRLQILDVELKQKGATAEEIALRRAQYFAQWQLWSDALREVFSVENPSAPLAEIAQSIPTSRCTRASEVNSFPSR
jgi:hypothetical protein